MENNTINEDITLDEYISTIRRLLVSENCPDDEIKFIIHFCKSKIRKFWEMGIEPELAVRNLTNS